MLPQLSVFCVLFEGGGGEIRGVGLIRGLRDRYFILRNFSSFREIEFYFGKTGFNPGHDSLMSLTSYRIQ